MLFSEPKIPQPYWRVLGFSASSVSVLFSEPKIPQLLQNTLKRLLLLVSVLFSEPKIPQLEWEPVGSDGSRSFSALQRAENSSTMLELIGVGIEGKRFSALQRAENSSTLSSHSTLGSSSGVSVLFSEPKIPQLLPGGYETRQSQEFQCSSASRKFLN